MARTLRDGSAWHSWNMLNPTLKQEISDLYRKLRDVIPGFKPRRSQAQMIGAIARALHADAPFIAIEAPTGTGKSLGYLLSAVPTALATDKTLIIATATVGLQEQLIDREIPAFKKATGLDFTAVLAKGRRRYLCARNLSLLVGTDTAQQALGLDDDGATASWSRMPRDGEVEAVAKLMESFDNRAWDGDMDRMPVGVADDLRAMMTTSAGGCSRNKCAYYKGCPLMAARKQIKEADVVVANMDLLIAELMMVRTAEAPEDEEASGAATTEGESKEEKESSGVILPHPTTCIYVIDEGHHLASKLIEHGGARVSLDSSHRWLKRIAALMKHAYGVSGKDKIGTMTLHEGIGMVNELRSDMSQWQERVASMWTPDATDAHAAWRAPNGTLPDEWVDAAQASKETVEHVGRWAAAVRRTVLSGADKGDKARDVMARELGMAIERLTEHFMLWRMWATPSGEGEVPRARWVELDEGRHFVVRASCVEASGLLRILLWERAAGVVLTSATLTVGGDFRRLRQKLGMPEDAETIQLESPFDLAAQGRIEVPFMRSLPQDNEGHAAEVAQWLSGHLDWNAGNLVLFTARKKMEAVISKLPADCQKKILVQGRGNRDDLLREHRSNIEQGQGSTLIGMYQLGEGLDLPGRLCETVVVTSLPFSVPTDPVGATYAEWLESKGRNPFAEVSVPDATRVLIQFCGRLIRTEEDSGRVVLLDRRIVTKAYGSRMLNALPPFERQIERRAPADPVETRNRAS